MRGSYGGLVPKPEKTDPITGQPVAAAEATLPNSAPSSPGALANVGRTPDQQNQTLAGGGAETYPMGANPGPGLEVTQQPGQAPFDPSPDRGPAGMKPRKMAEEDPAALNTAIVQAAGTASTTRMNADDNGAELKKLNKGLGITDKTIEQFQNEIYTGLKRAVEDKKLPAEKAAEYRKGWKRVFNTVHEDEMGLFLIDFGLRAMMAGETMGTMGALGAAGSGALGALQGRRRQSREDEMAMQAAAQQGGLDKYKAVSGRMTSEAQKESAAAATKRAEASAFGYRGEKVWLEEFFRKAGYTDKQIADYFMGAKGEQARRQDLTDALNKRIAGSSKFDMEVDPVTGKKYAAFEPEDVRAWVDAMMNQELGKEGALPEAVEPEKTMDDYYNETQ